MNKTQIISILCKLLKSLRELPAWLQGRALKVSKKKRNSAKYEISIIKSRSNGNTVQMFWIIFANILQLKLQDYESIKPNESCKVLRKVFPKLKVLQYFSKY